MSADMGFPQTKGKIMKINAIILNRSNRKFWYVRYQMFFENLDVTESEESTKVLKDEKDLKFMQEKYLPAWIANKQNKVQSQNPIIKKDLNYYANIFLKDYEEFKDYKNMFYRVRKIRNVFGARNISDITKFELKQWLNNMTNEINNENLSKNSKLKYLSAFHRIFEVAVDDNVIDKNWTYDIELSGKNKQNLENIMPFSVDEVKLLIQKSKDNSQYGHLLHNYLGIAFNQGISPHELLGLQINDIDFVNKTITINRGITKGLVDKTKNDFRKREIPIFESCEIFILDAINRAKELNSIWLFCDEDGKHLKDIKNIRGDKQIIKNGKQIKNTTKWYKLLEETGIKYRPLKNCRHTFAVRAIESKSFTLQEIANLLGHSSLKMLFEHYAKWISSKALSADRSINLF